MPRVFFVVRRVAQLASAPVWGTGGRGFESPLSDQNSWPLPQPSRLPRSERRAFYYWGARATKRNSLYDFLVICGSYLFIKREFETTLTDENAMAAAAIAGFKSQPVKGYKIPAATGIPTIL